MKQYKAFEITRQGAMAAFVEVCRHYGHAYPVTSAKLLYQSCKHMPGAALLTKTGAGILYSCRGKWKIVPYHFACEDAKPYLKYQPKN